MEIGMTKIKKGLLNNSLFRQCYIIVLLACDVSYVHFVAFFGLGLMVIWGSFLFIYNQVTRHTALKTRYGFWLIALLLSSFVTMMIHVLSNALLNFVFVMHLGMMFFIFYSVHTEKQLNFKHELFNVSRMIVYITTVLNAVGLLLLVLGVDFEFWKVKFIIYENRFTGLFTNPNYLGFTTVVALLCCHMLTKKSFVEQSGCRRVSRIWIGSCIALNAISLLLCDSNGAMILLAGYGFFFFAYKMFGTERSFSFGQIVVKSLASILVGVVIASSILLLRHVCQLGFSQLINNNQKITKPVVEIEPEKNKPPAPSFEHENKNVDSGRLVLWRQGTELFLTSPAIGIGKANIYDYGLDMFEHGVKFSDRYQMELGPYKFDIGSSPVELGPYSVDLGSFMTDLHNGYLTILVSSGVIGLLLFLIFISRFLFTTTKRVMRDDSLQGSIFPCLFAFICGYLVYSFVEVTLLFNITFTIVFFWMILGYASCFHTKNHPDHPIEHITVFGKKFRKTLL